MSKVVEDECSESQEESNRKEQKDEVEALESTYSHSVHRFCYTDNRRTISGSVSIEMPRSSTHFLLATGRENVQVHYLPPLLLKFAFPVDYPSHSMPHFSLQAIWLHYKMRDQLAKILTDSWSDYRGMPVLFTWVELLKEEAMRLIVNSQSVINLDEINEQMDESNKRTSDLLKVFTEYNEQAAQREFECEWYDCEVCFSSKSGKECIRFMPCGHIFCTDCVSEFYRQKLRDSMIQQLECLSGGGCGSTATQSQIRQVLTDQEFEIYEQRLLEGTLDLMSDVVICPRISCQAPVIVDDPKAGAISNLASCSLCHYSFCTLCKKTYHGIEPCSLTIESREKLLMQLENATEVQREEIYRRFGKEQIKQLIDALKSEQWIEKNSKACPSCSAKIEKKDGCNKMKCSKCGHHFCWLCGMLLSNKDPYSHFNKFGSSQCYNRLFAGIIEDDDDRLTSDSDSDSEDGN